MLLTRLGQIGKNAIGIYTCMVEVFLIELRIFPMLIYTSYNFLLPKKLNKWVLYKVRRIGIIVPPSGINAYTELI